MDVVRSRTLDMVFDDMRNGYVFEKLAQKLMGAILDTEFIPVGGQHDKGIDGIDQLFEQSSATRFKTIHQFSIESRAKNKVNKTIATLEKNGIEYDRLAYATNGIVDNIDRMQEEILERQGVHLQIRDKRWFDSHINGNAKAVSIFRAFVEDNFHSYHDPSSPYRLIDVEDAGPYIYLRQMVERSDYAAKLDETLIDTLILLGLEGTDSARGILRSVDCILSNIETITSFDPRWLREMVHMRLDVLSRKPLRKVKHHRKVDKYCLPYETRVLQAESQVEDKQLYDCFKTECEIALHDSLGDHYHSLNGSYDILERIFHDVFNQQGLEFAHFFQSGSGEDTVDKLLIDIVSNVLDSSSVPPISRNHLKQAYLQVVRHIVYNGKDCQLEFLTKLSSTYRMLFLVQCDPKLVNYFDVMAGKLRVFVDNSILIPAMSELFLPEQNRRYTNLLTCARDAGVQLRMTETVLEELVSHFWSLQQAHFEDYQDCEDLYSNEDMIVYVPQMLLRAYFYAKRSGKVHEFRSFYESFVTWNSEFIDVELVEWVKKAYGVAYEPVRELGLRIDPEEADKLFEILRDLKKSEQKARHDVEQLLSLYAMRRQNNEIGENGVFGYSTWWLTSDTASQRAFARLPRSGSERNPYMRADFLYNYIALAPSKTRVAGIFKKLFPTLLGVNMSFHIPADICDAIAENMKRHRELVSTPRFSAELRSLVERLKSASGQVDRLKIRSWFDERADSIVRREHIL